MRDSYDATKLCSYSRDKSWTCHSVIFTVPNNEEKRVFSPALEHNRVRRQADNLKLLGPKPPKRNVTFSVLTVAGIDWVCEQLSETQCKPLYPKVRNTAGLSRLVVMLCFDLRRNMETKGRWGPARQPEMKRWSIVGTVTLSHCVLGTGSQSHDIIFIFAGRTASPVPH